ncbi:phage major capsid protein [Candidatus Sarmatiella mevalonica]|uniref:phage major capsid protein n=1 Tax=Candidatus Sarmatiella mevalonica TaxID=2770581 RepID=UPI001920BF64|nr:phage major capsid protein [Candidatus Sarmatiella mevalonica]
MNNLEQKINEVHSFFSRQDELIGADIVHKKEDEFNNYLRTGNNDITLKSFLNSATDSAGVTIEPDLYSKILQDMKALSVMRQIASVTNTSSNILELLMDEENFQGAWVGEGAERKATNSAKFIKKSIKVHELYAQPRATSNLINDSFINLEEWLSLKIRDTFCVLEEEAFMVGDGLEKPMGILQYLKDFKNISANNGFDCSALLELIYMLDEKYLPNAVFLMHRTTLSAIQSIKDGDGRFILHPDLNAPGKMSIFGIPVFTSPHMPTVNGDKKEALILLGDFKSAYRIVDRTEMSVMRDPYTHKGFVSFYVTKRVGGDALDAKAIVALKIKTQ